MPDVLFLTTVLPRKQRMGSEVASQCFIDALETLGYKVTIIGYQRKDDVFDTLPSEIVVDKRYIETKKSKINTVTWLGLSWLLGLPYSAAKYYSNSYKARLRQCLSSTQYDLVVIDHPQLGWLHSLIHNNATHSQPPLVTIAHNIEHEIYRDNADSAQNPLAKQIYQREATLIQALEDTLAQQADQVWALTEHDATYFNQLNPRVKALAFALPPGITNQSPTEHPPKTFDIGLIGSWAWKPNEDGLRWFLQTVYPHLPDHLEIQVAGRGADWLIGQYANIQYAGFVPNAQTFMAQARVIAIPTLSGGGIQIKTLDAIASGSPIVATPIALRGITSPPPTVMTTADPQTFADYLVKTIQAPHPQGATDAKAWYRDRQQQFLSDLKTAISKLTLESTTEA